VDDYLWLMGRACYKPVIEYCGGTEIGGGFVTGSLLQPQALSAFSTPAMGCNMFILDSNGNPLVSVSMELVNHNFRNATFLSWILCDHIFPTNVHTVIVYSLHSLL
jgi:acyl-coenzyme A synthetase/AMP-(fatty) acid ligase